MRRVLNKDKFMNKTDICWKSHFGFMRVVNLNGEHCINHH